MIQYIYIIVVLNDQYIKVGKYEIKKDKIVKQLMAFTRMLTTYEITLGSFMTLKYLIMSSSFACQKNSLVQLTQRSTLTGSSSSIIGLSACWP